MSLEAFGNEGDVATSWDETAICQDFSKIRGRILNWVTKYRAEFPNEEFTTEVEKLIAAADEISEQMQGNL